VYRYEKQYKLNRVAKRMMNA